MAAANASTPSTFQAWTYTTTGYPSTLGLSTFDSPAVASLSPTSILLKVHAAALNPVDIQLMNFPVWSLVPFGLLAHPKPLCEDFSGTIVASGDSTTLKPGDEVYGIHFQPGGGAGAGTLTQLAVVDTAKAIVIKKPSRWSHEMAAALPLVWLTSRTCIEEVSSYVKSGHAGKLVVLGGSSATGMYCVHMARARGWNVLSSCSAAKADFVKSMGADEVIDYTSEDVPSRVKAFAPDAIIDCVGGTECLTIAKRYVTIVGDKTSRSSMGGNLIYFWNPQMALRWALGRVGLSSTVYDCVNLQSKKEWLEETLSLPEDKIIIDGVYPFDQAKEAFERLNTGKTKGKVVVKVDA